MVVKLSFFDAEHNELGLCVGFVFALSPSGDASTAADSLVHRLEEAGKRVIAKWPLLGGQAVKLEEENLWGVDLDTPDEGRPYFFTRSAVPTPYHEAISHPTPLTPLSASSSCTTLPTPLTEHFRSPSLPLNMSGTVESKHPMLCLHTTVFTNAIAIGASFPHGVFDAAGAATAIKALDAELHGQDWTSPPSFGEVNPVQAAKQALLARPPLTAEEEAKIPPTVENWIPYTGSQWEVKRVIWSIWYENERQKSKVRYAFLPQDKVDRLVERVKQEVKKDTDGRGYVSTGDVLTAFVLKSAHAAEARSSASVQASCVLNTRSLFSPLRPSPSTTPVITNYSYPHNVLSSYSYNPTHLPLRELAISSLATLALNHRRNVLKVKTPEYLQAVVAKEAKLTNGGKAPMMPKRDWPEPMGWIPGFWPRESNHVHRWVITNQMQAELGDFSLPHPTEEGKDLPLLSYHSMLISYGSLDHLFSLQRIPGMGVSFTGSMRESRWNSFVEALKDLDDEYGGV
ncbi:hypothetical protein JCM11251_004685 [Rhodosporidiobolus azoricus]